MAEQVDGRILAGKRLTRDGATKLLDGLGLQQTQQSEAQRLWYLGQNPEILAVSDMTTIVEVITSVSPNVSKALWDWLRFTNSGWKIKVTRPGEETEYKKAAKVLDRTLLNIEDDGDSLDVLFNRGFLAAFIRGGILTEAVLNNRYELEDMVSVDPLAVSWKKVKHPIRGQVWQIGQTIDGKWVSLETPTVRYVPIDPMPGKPHGRAMVMPSIYDAIYMMGLLQDIKRVVSQQGYPRLDLSVNMERILTNVPQLRTDPKALSAYVSDVIGEIQEFYAKLAPDDAYVHTDVVEVNRPVGTIDSNVLEGLAQLIQIFERQAVRALKTMPLLFGIADATTETHANRQWEITAAGVSSAQKAQAKQLSRLLSTVLRAQGIQAQVTLEFDSLRTSEAMRDEQVRMLRFRNNWQDYLAGYISYEEASVAQTGSAPYETEPLTLNPFSAQDNLDNQNVATQTEESQTK